LQKVVLLDYNIYMVWKNISLSHNIVWGTIRVIVYSQTIIMNLVLKMTKKRKWGLGGQTEVGKMGWGYPEAVG